MEDNSSLLNMLQKLGALNEILRRKFQNKHKIRKISPLDIEIIEFIFTRYYSCLKYKQIQKASRLIYRRVQLTTQKWMKCLAWQILKLEIS